MSTALHYVARSDVGLVRANNQDSAYAGPHLLVLADGMGGHAGGDIASSIAVATLAPLDDEAHGPDQALTELDRALHVAQSAIVERAQAEPDLAGMGTTLTALLRAGNKLVMAHIGDSRAYLLREGQLVQVTTDHTFVEYLVQTGRISADEARIHPQRSVVMRVLGDHGVEIVPDLSVREARPGDRWLLCSDGLSDVVSVDTIADTLAETADLDACADELIQLALRGGAHDNVTVVLADVVDIDALPDGAGPPAAPQIVGSVATVRPVPTVAKDGPAARAARLARQGKDDDDGDSLQEDPDPPQRRWVAPTIWLGVLALIVAGAAAFYSWTQQQFYVGASGGQVTIFRGIPASLGPVVLSTPVEVTGPALDDLPPFMRQRVLLTIRAESLEDARRIVEDNVLPEVTPSPTPEPTPTPTPSPTPTATTDPTASPDPG